MNRRTSALSSVSLVVLGLLLGLLMVLNILVSISTYKTVYKQVESSKESRLASSYILTKLRSHDHLGGIEVGKFSGADALFLYQDMQGVSYVDILYVYDNCLYELFCNVEDLSEFTAGDGTDLIPVLELKLSEDSGVVYISIVGKTRVVNNLSYKIKSGEYCG